MYHEVEVHFSIKIFERGRIDSKRIIYFSVYSDALKLSKRPHCSYVFSDPSHSQAISECWSVRLENCLVVCGVWVSVFVLLVPVMKICVSAKSYFGRVIVSAVPPSCTLSHDFLPLSDSCSRYLSLSIFNVLTSIAANQPIDTKIMALSIDYSTPLFRE